jgi:hypothetical protein
MIGSFDVGWRNTALNFCPILQAAHRYARLSIGDQFYDSG